MKEKYFDAIAFFYETEDKAQLKISVKEYQRFSFFYDKMNKYLELDPSNIEEDVYNVLDEETKKGLNNLFVLQEMNKIRI